MGYETTVLNVLDDNGIVDCYFENDCLYLPSGADPERVFEVLANTTNIYSLPAVRVLID